MKKIILLLHCAFSIAILSGGIHHNTFVATSRGHIEIARLNPGDRVFCLDENFVLDEGLITAIQDYNEDELVEIITEDGNCIQVSKQQKLFSFHCKEWVEAHKLILGESLLKKDGSSIKVTNVNTKHSVKKMRSITVDKHHNFFIGDNELLVHNWAFVLPILSWGAGAAVTWFEGVTLAGIVTAVVGLVVKEKVMEGIEKATGIPIQSKQSVAYVGAAKGAHNQPEKISKPLQSPVSDVSCVTSNNSLQCAARYGSLCDNISVTPITHLENPIYINPIIEISNESSITPINNLDNCPLITLINNGSHETLITPITVLDKGLLIRENSAKSVEDIMGESVPGKESGETQQYINPGDFGGANNDFDSLSPIGVRDRGNGLRTGVLSDGRVVIVRPTSSNNSRNEGGFPTLEIQEEGKKTIKIRYTKK